MSAGRFITFEGPEGSGKSTHIQELESFLAQQGIRSIRTREPGGTKLGERIRELLQHDAAGESPVARAEVMLFLASRAQLVENVIRPALAEGVWVLADRFDDSTFAYQGYGRGFPIQELRLADTFATGGLVPDLTFLLDVPLSVMRERLSERDTQDRFEREGMEFHRKIRDGFLQLAAESPDRMVVVDSSRVREVVRAEIEEVVRTRFLLQSGAAT